jgi:hypothetical protein
MMPGITHEMHVYVWRWWDRFGAGVEFHHTIEAMRNLNMYVVYNGANAYIDHTEFRWRVTPSVFVLFRWHMRERHGLDIDQIQQWLSPDQLLPVCCDEKHRRRFFL